MMISFLLSRIMPLLMLILCGYGVSKLLGARKESIATVLLYVIAPAVVIHAVWRAPMTMGNMLLPLVMFVLCTSIAFGVYAMSSPWLQGSRRNLASFAAGTGNTGYFGLPLAMALMGDEIAPAAVLATLGVMLYENSVGLFITGIGRFSMTECLRRAAKLPSVYAFLAGLLFNGLSVQMPGGIDVMAVSFRGAYSVLGMMIVGMGIADVVRLELDRPFLMILFAAKFVAWPILMLCVIAVDHMMFGVMDVAIYQLLWLLSCVPLAANTVAIATELRTEPEMAASAVLLSTIFVIPIIPLAVSLCQSR